MDSFTTDTEVCILCMENNKDLGKSIRVDSIKWQKENVQSIIEKYLWPMDTIMLTKQTSLVCSICWQKLYDFHTFYIRIENVHLKSGTVINIGIGMLDISLDDNHEHLESKKIFDKHNLVRKRFDSEILLEQPMPTDFVTANNYIGIKEENGELCFDFRTEEVQLKGQQIQNLLKNKNELITEDPLNKIKQTKRKNLKMFNKRSSNLLNDKLEISDKKLSKPLESYDDMESDIYLQKVNDPQPLETIKKKRKNPDEKTSQEYDKFISENFQIVCSICHVSLENFIFLRKHFRDEHNKRGFVICCKKKIFSRPLLVDHIQIHIDPNYFKCQQCNKVYSERSTLDSHAKIHDINLQGRIHSCEKCGKTFVGNSQLDNHKRMHEPGYEKQFSCKECGKFFTTSHSLNYHIQAIHHNKYVNICDICGKSMRCRNQFKLHMEKHNSKESMTMNCDICGLRLTDRRGLRRHKNSQHPVGGKKEYSCHLCTKVSSNPEALKTHIRLTHSPSYNHKCAMCNKAFKRPNALREHMATHTGTALYTCPWCPKTFISNGNMHNHRKRVHPLEWKEAQQNKFSKLFSSEQKLI